MRDVVSALAAAGHHHVGHVGGPAQMAHTIIRRHTFLQAAGEFGLQTSVFDGDYSEAAGARAVTAVQELADRPTALHFDNDVMALGALDEARQLGLAIPDDLSLVAWDDSALCQLAVPSLAAVSHDVQVLGELAGEALADVLGGAPAQVVRATPAQLVARASLKYIDY